MLVGVLNFASEKADTRNWQTLPHSIHYTRVPLNKGKNEVKLHTGGPQAENVQEFMFEGKSGKTQFQIYQSLESNIAF